MSFSCHWGSMIEIWLGNFNPPEPGPGDFLVQLLLRFIFLTTSVVGKQNIPCLVNNGAAQWTSQGNKLSKFVMSPGSWPFHRMHVSMSFEKLIKDILYDMRHAQRSSLWPFKWIISKRTAPQWEKWQFFVIFGENDFLADPLCKDLCRRIRSPWNSSKTT